MISGPNWPIPHDKLMDGTIISLKNADELAKDSVILLKQGRYARALSLATISLEEFGKHCMLQEYSDSNRKITSKIWKDEFEDHKQKLKAISELLKKFADPKDKAKTKRLKKIKNYLASLSKRKLQAYYVDWDAQKNEWFYFEDSSSNKILKDEVEEAVYTATFVVKKYLEDIGGDKDLILTVPSKVAELFQKKKIHSFCKECNRIIMTLGEINSHTRICGKPNQWYWN